MLLNFLRPTTIKQLRRFLGMLNFYRKFIKGCAQFLALLNQLLCGNAKDVQLIKWTPVLKASFSKSAQTLANVAYWLIRC